MGSGYNQVAFVPWLSCIDRFWLVIGRILGRYPSLANELLQLRSELEKKRGAPVHGRPPSKQDYSSASYAADVAAVFGVGRELS